MNRNEAFKDAMRIIEDTRKRDMEIENKAKEAEDVFSTLSEEEMMNFIKRVFGINSDNKDPVIIKSVAGDEIQLPPQYTMSDRGQLMYDGVPNLFSYAVGTKPGSIDMKDVIITDNRNFNMRIDCDVSAITDSFEDILAIIRRFFKDTLDHKIQHISVNDNALYVESEIVSYDEDNIKDDLIEMSNVEGYILSYRMFLFRLCAKIFQALNLSTIMLGKVPPEKYRGVPYDEYIKKIFNDLTFLIPFDDEGVIANAMSESITLMQSLDIMDEIDEE